MHDLLAGIRKIVQQAQENISCFVLFGLEVCIDIFGAARSIFQRVRLPSIPHGLFVVRHAHVYFDVLPPSIPGRIHSWGAAWRKDVYPRVAVFVGPHQL